MTIKYKGKRFHVKAVGEREYISHPGAVVILPLIDPETVVLIRNYRFSIDQTQWELPAGTLEPGEKPEQTAARELIEETGYRASTLKHLFNYYVGPGVSNEMMHVYMATDLEEVGQQLNEDEQITTEIVPLEKAIKMVEDGTISNAKTIITLLWLIHLGKK